MSSRKNSGPRLFENWHDSWAPMWVVSDGKVLSMAEYRKATGITARMIGYRLNELGWSEMEALSTPPKPLGRPRLDGDKV